MLDCDLTTCCCSPRAGWLCSSCRLSDTSISIPTCPVCVQCVSSVCLLMHALLLLNFGARCIRQHLRCINCTSQPCWRSALAVGPCQVISLQHLAQGCQPRIGYPRWFFTPGACAAMPKISSNVGLRLNSAKLPASAAQNQRGIYPESPVSPFCLPLHVLSSPYCNTSIVNL